MGWGLERGLCPQKKHLVIFLLQNYNVVNKCLRNINDVTNVNRFELPCMYEYICILMQSMHCTGISNAFLMCTAKLCPFLLFCYAPKDLALFSYVYPTKKPFLMMYELSTSCRWWFLTRVQLHQNSESCNLFSWILTENSENDHLFSVKIYRK